ncbi:SidA/IucD/PvdA family monooxygenase [Paraburkholderia tropica]|uniref:SidA/IucD/PvdA family monooxygenase n=1 Tax=Paraburkholderia tropica TaxID=92647 RepID=UPI002AB16763|nr:SidA/IucD/PvdA family monooxygenase [Paraburkholderia tropica]
MTSLHNHQLNVERSFRWSAPQPAAWIPPRPESNHDVVVVGGGQNGVAIAYGLRRQGVNNVLVIDQARKGEAGIWTNIARMQLLRTSKFLAGPEFGNPVLSFRAWFEAQFGMQAFDELERIHREDWAAYLSWYQRILQVDVQYETRLQRIEALESGLLRLYLSWAGRDHVVVARKLVLATGFTGAGTENVPELLRSLPRHFWAHTSDPIDFSSLAGRRVAIVGAGPSAFDAAGVALEHGAAEVHLFSRRDAIQHQPNSPRGVTPPVPPSPVAAPARESVGRNYPGAFEHFHQLPDAVRWRYHLNSKGAPASTPEDSIRRATAHANFHLHLSASWDNIDIQDGNVSVVLKGEAFNFDYVIAGTGLRIDLGTRPELTGIIERVAHWGDRYTPAVGEEFPAAALYPYLGDAFEFLEKQPGAAPYVSHIHCYNWAAALSSGKNLSDIPSMPELNRLISGLTRNLFLEDLPHHTRRITGSEPHRPDASIYAEAVWPARRASSTVGTYVQA